MIQTVRHVGIVVKNIDTVLHFYQNLLNLRLVKQTDEPEILINPLLILTHCRLKTIKLAAKEGKTLIELLEFTSHPSSEVEKKEIFTPGLTHVAFTVKDLDELFLKLSGEGVQFISPPITTPDGLAKVAFCKDPEGTYLELVEELK